MPYNNESYKREVSFDEVMNIYSMNHKFGDKAGIKKAYSFAEEHHKGVKRGSGEDYICHPLRVARLLADWGFESEILIAALLHDVVEDCGVPLSEIRELFGSRVAEIVDSVTALTDKDFDSSGLSKSQLDILSDARLQRKMSERALYVKIADRIDNLNTLDGVKRCKWEPKAEHTREIIIPMAMMMEAYNFVDILEELCFKVESEDMYKKIKSVYDEILEENAYKCMKSLDILAKTFNSQSAKPFKDPNHYRQYIVNFQKKPCSCISIFRQVCNLANNINEDTPSLLNKSTIPLYDLTVVVNDVLGYKNSSIRPDDIFFILFDEVLSRKGFYLISYNLTYYKDAGYYLIMDDMNNMYRVFMRTQTEFQRYLYGNIIDEDTTFSITHVNDLEPRETYNEVIKVFRRDGTFLIIDKGATVLDFAFYIHGEIGMHFNYALINGSPTKMGIHTRLKEGDQIVVFTKEDILPEITWFRHAKTTRAINHLITYFQRTGLEPKNTKNTEE
jgi:(p)ppGpp synthase/HD superfamily hydrolase